MGLAEEPDEQLEAKTLMKYELVIYWSEPDKAFIAEVPELPDAPPMGRRTKRSLRTCSA